MFSRQENGSLFSERGKKLLWRKNLKKDGFHQVGFSKNDFDIQGMERNGIALDGFNRKKELFDFKEKVQQGIMRNAHETFSSFAKYENSKALEEKGKNLDILHVILHLYK